MSSFLFISTQSWLFWSLDQLVVETLGVVFVRSYVRSYVRPSHCFSETAHYFFMKLENFHRFGHFGQKLSKMALFGQNDQNGGFWHFFLELRIKISYFVLEA